MPLKYAMFYNFYSCWKNSVYLPQQSSMKEGIYRYFNKQLPRIKVVNSSCVNVF